MMRTRFLFFLLFSLSFSTHCFAQKVIVDAFIENKKAPANSDTIYYDFNRKLAWTDFQGKPDANNFAGAVTSSGFAFNSEMNFVDGNLHLTIRVYSYFSKRDSWKKSNINSGYHLLHEQHHFDITRLGAQKLIDELQKANFTKANYNSLITSIFNKVYNENIELQNRYDRETKNSMDIKKQMEWNEKLAAELLVRNVRD